MAPQCARQSLSLDHGSVYAHSPQLPPEPVLDVEQFFVSRWQSQYESACLVNALYCRSDPLPRLAPDGTKAVKRAVLYASESGRTPFGLPGPVGTTTRQVCVVLRRHHHAAGGCPQGHML